MRCEFWLTSRQDQSVLPRLRNKEYKASIRSSGPRGTRLLFYASAHMHAFDVTGTLHCFDRRPCVRRQHDYVHEVTKSKLRLLVVLVGSRHVRHRKGVYERTLHCARIAVALPHHCRAVLLRRPDGTSNSARIQVHCHVGTHGEGARVW